MTGTPEEQVQGAEVAEPGDAITRGFLFADLRGYTEYVERHGGEAAAGLLARYRDLVRGQVARFRGAEIKTEGDSFYVVFPSVSAAVRAGLTILELAGQEAADPQHALRVGIGVHAGETVETSEGYVGTPVNIAARLCALAAAGELLVSDTVRALTSTVVRARFVAKGRRQLKGIAEPVQVFAVSPPVEAVATTPLRVRGGRAAIGGAGVTVAIVVAIIVALAVGNRGATPGASDSPGPTAALSATVSPSAGPSGVTARERDLLEVIPTDLIEHCDVAPDDAIQDATATVRCELPIGSGADAVWWHYFETEGETALAFDRIANARDLPELECGPDVAAGRGEWRLGRTFSGDRACYMEEERAWAVWTYLDEQVLARAVRNDGDVRELHAWWQEIAQYLRST